MVARVAEVLILEDRHFTGKKGGHANRLRLIKATLQGTNGGLYRLTR